MSQRLWTEAELETLRRLVAEGRSREHIRIVLDRPESSVDGKMVQLKLRAPGAIRRHKQPPWTREEIETAQALRATGPNHKSLDEVAAIVGHSRKAVSRKLSELSAEERRHHEPANPPRVASAVPEQPAMREESFIKAPSRERLMAGR